MKSMTLNLGMSRLFFSKLGFGSNFARLKINLTYLAHEIEYL